MIIQLSNLTSTPERKQQQYEFKSFINSPSQQLTDITGFIQDLLTDLYSDVISTLTKAGVNPSAVEAHNIINSSRDCVCAYKRKKIGLASYRL